MSEPVPIPDNTTIIYTTPVHLTRREREVVAMAAVGRSDREIAQELVLSLRTVEGHLYRAYAKLGVSGRDELSTVPEYPATPGGTSTRKASVGPALRPSSGATGPASEVGPGK